jgi:hypothetical protein
MTADARKVQADGSTGSSSMSLSPELIAKLNALASRLTQMGEYEAVDLIDTVVARVSGAALEPKP